MMLEDFLLLSPDMEEPFDCDRVFYLARFRPAIRPEILDFNLTLVFLVIGSASGCFGDSPQSRYPFAGERA